MAYKALYRQFRPRRFCELKDQDAVAEILKNQVKTGQPAHAYVFSGPRGTGKTSTARILAAALNCLDPQDGEPCLKCDNCLAALNETMPDIIEMDAASNTGVDDARALREKINLMPAMGRYKIYIIDEVHMLSNSAFNALLKTLEEPPEYGVFILATTELRKLPRTVLSRCQRFDFKAVEDKDIVAMMREILEKTDGEADDGALEMIAGAAEGGMRDALTILEKCCSMGGCITESMVASVLNLADLGAIGRLTDMLADFDESGAIDMLYKLADSGVEPALLTSQLLQSVRSRLMGLVTGDAAGSKWTKEGALRALDVLADAESRMAFSSKPQILLESAVMHILLPERGDVQGDTALRIEKLEKKIEKLKSGAVAVQVSAAAAPKGQPKTQRSTERVSAEASADAAQLWSSIAGEMKAEDSISYKFVADFRAVSYIAGRLTLTHDTPSRARLLATENNGVKERIIAAAERVTGKKIAIEVLTPESRSETVFDDAEIVE